MTVRMTADNVLMRRSTSPDMVGRIVVPEGAREKKAVGEVLAVGPKCTDVGPGDMVLFPKYGGDDVEVDGEKLLVIPEAQLYAIVGAGHVV